MRELALPLEGMKGYGILMGTDATMKVERVCLGIILTLQNIEIVEDFLPLELGSADVILEMKWLESLGGMQVNWSNITMRFQVGGVSMILQGDPSLSTSLVSLKSLWKAIQHQGEGVSVELRYIEVMENEAEFEITNPLRRYLTNSKGFFIPH